MYFLPFWVYHVNNNELELLYRALAFAQSNFPQTLVIALLYTSLIMQTKKRIPPLYLFVAILISYYYRISLSYFFCCKNRIVAIFTGKRKGFVKNILYKYLIYIYLYNYIKIDQYIFDYAFSIFEIFLRIKLSLFHYFLPLRERKHSLFVEYVVVCRE